MASLKSPLILSSEKGSHNIGARDEISLRSEIYAEVKRQLWLSGPLICISLLQNCLQVISVMFVGHLGELPLSGASMATSFAGVTGFSLLVITIRTPVLMLPSLFHSHIRQVLVNLVVFQIVATQSIIMTIILCNLFFKYSNTIYYYECHTFQLIVSYACRIYVTFPTFV